MSLKFSYTGWARLVARIFGGFESAGVVHRVCAIITFTYFGLHVWDLLKRKRVEAGGLKNLVIGPDSMLLNKRDGQEFVGSLKWFIGRGPRPEYGRWTYWEKFDYFAVFWGVAVIGATGLLLWLPELFTKILPGSFLNVATIIHSDEALLAVGLHLHDPLLQHALPAGEVPDGPGDLHRPRAARGVQDRPAARVRGDGRQGDAWRSTWSSRRRRRCFASGGSSG